MKLSRSKKRRSTLGAAMVEAGIVAPVLAIFLGLMIFTYNTYSQKLASMHDARRNAWNYASHSCGSGQGHSGIIPIPTQDDADPQALSTKKNDEGAKSAVSKTLRFATAQIVTTSRAPFAWQKAAVAVHSSAYCMCDEVAYDSGFGSLVGWFYWAIGYLRGGFIAVP